MSYNFEANYAAPTTAAQWTQALDDKFFPLADQRKRSNTEEKRALSEPKFTRKHFYNMVESYIGRQCLLRLICENQVAFMPKYNQVLGDVLHIIFTPSSSASEEDLGSAYEFAELQGKAKSCKVFEILCPKNYFQLISQIY